jgi:hypothetical protein
VCDIRPLADEMLTISWSRVLVTSQSGVAAGVSAQPDFEFVTHAPSHVTIASSYMFVEIGIMIQLISMCGTPRGDLLLMSGTRTHI